ncbi:P-loop NTPase fold protein [Anabaenopsis tanganyikae CS-531]|uniref:P-loop NTPase fold protein n=1 Tax=Anabaenopsis tanganyikae CS-531 TaxID=2785304 RepID=A0ABT6KH81_9CYAN|nr:P-loop NTPase fold protein [Anabaenopsis tanganyikae]MDH6107192.1 P-loop NTPase fold protein [Anabaenopsis tanganyikae CS-531]
MTNTPISSIEAVNAAIKNHNPFTNAGIVKEQDVWGKGVPDVPTLNAHASNKVFEAIEFVRTSQLSQDKVTSIVITAQQGVGKTHLLSRIRHQLETKGGALFVYAGGNNYTDLNLVKYQFQQTLADSLSETGSQGVMQWQEVAAAMANETRGDNCPQSAELVKKFDQAYKKSLDKNKNLMNALQAQVLKNKPNADPYILRAILWTLSETQAPFAIRWLSGEELAQVNADELGLPNSPKSNQDKEAEALKNIQQVLNLVSFYNPVIICFDEIDVKNNSTEDGLPTESVIANLVKILHDTLENSELSQGVVFLTVMLPETWREKVNLIPGGTPDRVSKFTQRKPIELKYVSSDSMVDLVTVWLQEFYHSKQLIPPHSLYPFTEGELREYGKNKRPTVREALQWCAKNFKVDELPPDPLSRFELAFTKESNLNAEDYLQDNNMLAEALCFGFETLINHTLEGVKIEEIIRDIKPKSQNKNWIKFKIVGTENGAAVKIGVSVIQDSRTALCAGLKRLIDYQTFDLTRGCLVRSQDKIEKMNKNSEAYKLLEELISQKGGEHVDLIEEQIRPLIAIYSIYQKCSNYDLTDAQIFDIITQNKITIDNLLLREILSDPSGILPDADDSDILDELFDPTNLSETDESDESDELSDLYS